MPEIVAPWLILEIHREFGVEAFGKLEMLDTLFSCWSFGLMLLGLLREENRDGSKEI